MRQLGLQVPTNGYFQASCFAIGRSQSIADDDRGQSQASSHARFYLALLLAMQIIVPLVI